MLVIILGKLGSGKTFIMTLLALMYNRIIWSNYELDIPNYKQLDIIDLFDLDDNIVILMDEGYNWLESRNSNSSINEYLTSILYHTRKSFTDIYITTPLFSTIDKRFRKQANFIIYCRHRSNEQSDDFYFTIHDKDNNTYSHKVIPYELAKPFFKIYNTYEKIESHRKRYIQFKLLQKYPERLRTHIYEISEVIRENPKLTKITHDIVKSCLLDEGIDLDYAPYVYIRLKGIQNNVNN